MKHLDFLASTARFVVVGLLATGPLSAQTNPRAREIGIPLDGIPGPLDAITDVAGIEVGHATLIRGEGKLVIGQGPVRTGVTAVLPRGKADLAPVFAAWWSLNGNGEMTGTTWVEESGLLEGPVLITNTQSVGVVRDAAIEWLRPRTPPPFLYALPVVAETYDGDFSDANGHHVSGEHVVQALDSARGGPVEEGNVGGGTGMGCNGFKGGIGTASRALPAEAGGYTVGALVQCNYGDKRHFRVAGAPVGLELADLRWCADREAVPEPSGLIPWVSELPACGGAEEVSSGPGREKPGSIIVVIATDAPLLPHQLKRVAKRAGVAMGRMGGYSYNGSGDIFLAFSTANERVAAREGVVELAMLPNERIDPILEATVYATEAAILNAMLAARTMTGADGVRMPGLPADRLVQALEKYGREVRRPASR